jgi:hypothetical protein
MERGQYPIWHKNILTMSTKQEHSPGPSRRFQPMPANSQPETDWLEAATDQAIAACGGNARDAVRALILANEQLLASVSNG